MRHIVNAILCREGAVLMARRSAARKAYAGCWSFPGGHVEPGEALEAALSRECGEEIGIVPRAVRGLGAIAGRADLPAAQFHIFAVTAWDGVPRIRDAEHSELRWMPAVEAAALRGLALEEYRPLLLALG